ncbi:MAG: hypothetical protein DWQ36_00850 [Acidobacteria bacterium]|nr:MAG: hypothetical protein DWQ30_08985 [Acidobacteriota bacterium]REK11806.1 MAG: hypothetical protein DWQ36_00850 [Acidobacteriota bacterium]
MTAQLDPSAVERRWRELLAAEQALRGVGAAQLWRAWSAALERLQDDGDLHTALSAARGEHPATVRAGVAAVLEGLCDEDARRHFDELTQQFASREAGRSGEDASSSSGRRALVVLPVNVPLLAAQSAFFALAARRPTLFKLPSAIARHTQSPTGSTESTQSARSADDGAAALLAALGDELPALARLFASARWPGGAPGYRELERRLAEEARPLVVYGGDAALASYRPGAAAASPAGSGDLRAEFGPRGSAALVPARWLAELDAPSRRAAADRLARDVVLFDQRGCLSPRTVLLLLDGAAAATAESRAAAVTQAVAWLRAGLERSAVELPGRPAAVEERAALRHVASQAELQGRAVQLGTWGAVVEAPAEALPEPLPGSRALSLTACDAVRCAELLASRAEELQGLAIAGLEAEEAPEEIRLPLRPGALSRLLGDAALEARIVALRERGTRVAAAGHLQRTGSRWRNGGVDLAELFLPADRGGG